MKKVIVVLCVLGTNVPHVVAQHNSQVSQPKHIPIKSVLKIDGTLNLMSGVSGILNVDGWKMESGPRGEPRFVRDQPRGVELATRSLRVGPGERSMSLGRQSFAPYSVDNTRWDDRFRYGGIVGDVYAVAVKGTDVYVGGQFLLAGGIPANNIAKWNGTSWSALGEGVDGWIQALTFVGEDLYAGGRFWNAGGLRADNIAKWNGTTWSPLGGGTSQTVYALATDGTSLFVAGDFSQVANSPDVWTTVNYVAKWNGSTWSGLGSGMSFRVHALSVMGGNLYAGGWFTVAGGITANQIAKWDGTNWSSLGAGAANGTNSGVFALTNDGTTLYVGGTFTQAGGASANYVATWSGTTWGALGTGAGDEVYALQLFGGDLYAGGDFFLSEEGLKYAAKWDGESWSPVLDEGGRGPDGTVYGFAASVTKLYVVTDGKPNVQEWDGSEWQAVSNPAHHGLDGTVRALGLHGGNLYAGGDFKTADGMRVNHIAKWDGAGWSALGEGFNGPVHALLIYDDILYAGGSFTNAGELSVGGIARWYDGTWEGLEDGFFASGEATATVKSLAAKGNLIYAGGSFQWAGETSAINIARWDTSTSTWSPLMGVFDNGVNNTVYALAVIEDTLYVGGDFTTVGGADIASRIAKWDGSTWYPLGSGANSSVYALAVMGTDLYVGGRFGTAGGLANSANLARWDRTSWSTVGNGTVGTVRALATNGSHLYVGGEFITVDQIANLTADYVALWNGSSWSALGSGLDGEVRTLAAAGTNLYVGGEFWNAGGKPSTYIAKWEADSPVAVVASPVAPTLSSPSNGATGVSVTPTLVWNTVTGASSYRVQASSVSDFASTIVNAGGIVDTSHTISAPLNNGTQYYWRVKAYRSVEGVVASSAWSVVRNFTTVSASPAAPVLSSPRDQQVTSLTPDLQWGNLSGVTSYTVQVAGSASFATPVVNQTLAGTTYQVTAGVLLYGTSYYWRVRASNSGGPGPWSSVRQFQTLVPVPGTPVLNAPGSGETGVSLTPTLSWSSAEDATEYEVYVSDKSDFSTLVHSNFTTAISFAIPAGVLGNDKMYYWRVKGWNIYTGGSWSAGSSFKTVVATPAVPSLVTPASGSTNIALTPTLTWTKAERAESYQIQLSPNAEFTLTLIDVSNITDTSYAIATGVLQNDATYYWRGRSRNTGGTSAWTAARSFRTLPAVPAVPVLVGPSSGATSIPLTPTLRWSGADRAGQYQLQVSASADFSILLINAAGVTDTSYGIAAGVLTNDRVCYWRVRASNSAGSSAWSGVWSFRTVVAPPSAPALHTPSGGAVNFSRTPTFIWRTSAGAGSYELQVSKVADFGSTVISSVRSDTVFAVAQSSPLDANTKHFWRVRASNAGGSSSWTTGEFTTSNLISDVSRLNQSLPTPFGLEQNYPNPFNPTTAMRFSLAERSMVTLEVYSYVGQRVALLISGELSAGAYESRWTALDLSSGMYFYRLTAQPVESAGTPFVQTRKMALMK